MADVIVMRDMAEEAMEELLASDWLTTDELQRLIDRAGRTYGPDFLHQAYLDGVVDKETVTDLVGRVWSMSEFPDRQLKRHVWRWLFQVAGFTVDGQRTERPTEPIELWRGTVPERRTDWSWTTDRAVAEKFADGMRGRLPGQLYRLMAPPERLLCANTERGESEYVVDTEGLLIEEADR